MSVQTVLESLTSESSPTTHSAPAPHQCEEDKKSFRTESLTMNECATVQHPSEESKKSSVKCTLVRHENILEGRCREKPFKCERCLKSYTRKFGLKNHVCTGKKQFQCEICQQKFLGKISLKKHMITHTRGRRKFSCKWCQKSFGFNCGLVAHERIHTDEKPFLCKQCQKSFRCMIDMRRHECQQATAGKQGKILCYCPHCHLGFRQKKGRTNHSRTCFSKMRFFCKECRQGFRRRTELDIHEGKTHPKEQCDPLVTHDFIDTGEKSFPCHQCKRTFGQKSAFEVHMCMRTRIEEGPHKCTQCELSFITRRQLMKHELKHVKMTYQCPHCVMGFSDAQSLQDHQVTHRPTHIPEVIVIRPSKAVTATVEKSFNLTKCQNSSINLSKCQKSSDLVQKQHTHELPDAGKKTPHCRNCQSIVSGPQRCTHCELAFIKRKQSQLKHVKMP